MEKFNEKQRKVVIETARQESRRQDVKQHCTKIRDGIERLDKNSGDRAIWELLQNARDLSSNACINIQLESHMLTFKHQGKPFTFDSLSSLVKQVSSQSKEGDDSVGQYGTGFLTTHKFSRRIIIEGSLQADPENNPDVYFDIDNFIIDREFADITEFVEKMANQIKAVEQMLENGNPTKLRQWTKLMYPINENNYSIAQQAIESAIKLMPYVMVVNKNIKQCEIEDKVDKRCILFTKEDLSEDHELKVVRINISENGISHPFDCFYLESTDKKDIVIFPLETATKTRNIDDIAKLFLFFPLLGTENLGVNFIFHSERFYPEEARNGILLPRDNNNIIDKYNSNVNVLNEMTDMLFCYLRNHIQNIEGTIEMSSIAISTASDDKFTQQFHQQFKNRWTETFKTLPIVCTDSGRLSICEHNGLLVFDAVLTDMFSDAKISSKYLDALYSYASKVAVLPIKKECVRWSRIINEWGLSPDDINLSVDAIAKKVSEEHEGELHKFLEFVNVCQQSTLFSKYELIPNREGKLYTSTRLKKGKTITPKLYDLVRPIITASMDTLVDTNYEDIISLDEYNRKSLQSDISSRLLTERGETLDNRQGSIPFNTEFSKVLRRYCCVFSTTESDLNRSRIMKQVCLINKEEFIETIIPKITSEDPDLYDTAFRILLESELLNISTYDSKWVAENHSNLFDLDNCISQVKESDFKKRYFTKYSVFPNQRQNLCLATELKINKGTDNDLAILYNKVFGGDIYEQWVDEEFATLYDFEPYEAKDVARKIEDKLEESEYSSELTINIIEAIDKGDWKGLFKNIESNKETIFFTRVPKENKSNVYKLMKIRDNNILEALANLSENPRVNEILQNALQIIKEEELRQADFEFKKEIGKHIEKLIKERILTELKARIEIKTKEEINFDLTVDDIQNGQDIIISVDGVNIYYIEIKAKWSFKVDPAHMSKNQMIMAIRNPNNYSLCCIDLTEEKENYYPNMTTVIDNTYVHNKIADELDDIMGGIAKTDFSEYEGITMGGDYRCNISKKVFKNGDPFNSLISKIITMLSH